MGGVVLRSGFNVKRATTTLLEYAFCFRDFEEYQINVDDQSHAAKYTTMRALMNTKITKETLVRNHDLKICVFKMNWRSWGLLLIIILRLRLF